MEQFCPCSGPCTGRKVRVLVSHLTQWTLFKHLSGSEGELPGCCQHYQGNTTGRAIQWAYGASCPSRPLLGWVHKITSQVSDPRIHSIDPSSEGGCTAPPSCPKGVGEQYLLEAESSYECQGWLGSPENCWGVPRWSLVKERNKITFRIS